jgi:hypothetical protein
VADGVFVLGMHRGGTSAATRLITLLGVDAPRVDDLVPPSAKNPTGYWESMSLVWFNTRVLSAIASDMRCPVDVRRGWERDARLDPLRGEAPAAVRDVFPSEPWVWKDPRNCLTLAFWRSVLDVDPVVVLVNRNPLEIEASSRRTGHWTGRRHSLALWERYMRQALVQASGLPLLVTSYHHLLTAPLEWIERIGDFLDRVGVRIDRVRAGEAPAFVDATLRHAAFAREDFFEAADVSDSQRALFVALEQLELRGDPSFRPTLPPETPATERLLAEQRQRLRAERPSRSAVAAARRLCGGIQRFARRAT